MSLSTCDMATMSIAMLGTVSVTLVTDTVQMEMPACQFVYCMFISPDMDSECTIILRCEFTRYPVQ